MLNKLNGGYDQGYSAVKGFWGTTPGSLVSRFISLNRSVGLKVLDVGAGEGKNAAALAAEGASVDALECSEYAIGNGRDLFDDRNIKWIQCDARIFSYEVEYYDLVVCYGLIHCMENEISAESLILSLQNSLKSGGTFLLVSFNDGSHDMTAHPGFDPLLLKHDWFLAKFEGWKLEVSSDSLLYELHPHNNISHHHSLTRLYAVKP